MSSFEKAKASLALALATPPQAPLPPVHRTPEPGHGRVLLEVTLGQDYENESEPGGAYTAHFPVIENVRVLMHTVDDSTLRMLEFEGTEMDFSELNAAIATLGDAPEAEGGAL